ncbi:hypothetical protein J1N35_037018 [Gossypium stocksii]|uniref:Uncharacterized protein n=1 Tax=Gossypium stocksii TaxID=47602 RepID=A0A9D3ZLA4_9ROSI|nr:hypothetical protein J1N35_037018 [Gossypium stocksii]
MEYKLDIVSLLETKVSGGRADGRIAKLGFQNSHPVEARGFSGGIWMGWKGKLIVGLKEWNRNVYGHIGVCKWKLVQPLSHIQKEIERSDSETFLKREMDIREELEEMLNHEELLWKQKSRCDWLKLRDRNTKFFHNRTMYRRKVNRINALRNRNGEWLYDLDEIQSEVVSYF